MSESESRAERLQSLSCFLLLCPTFFPPLSFPLYGIVCYSKFQSLATKSLFTSCHSFIMFSLGIDHTHCRHYFYHAREKLVYITENFKDDNCILAKPMTYWFCLCNCVLCFSCNVLIRKKIFYASLVLIISLNMNFII